VSIGNPLGHHAVPSVAVLVGSLRKGSINRRFAEVLAHLAEGRLRFDFVEISALPMYNDDLWVEPPPSVVRLKEEIAAADAVLFVTPEYNRSIPPVLKNAIDWGSRPKGQNVWAGKPGAVVGASPGNIGAAVAQSHLRYVAGVVDIAVLGQPEVYLSFKPGLVDASNHLTDDATRLFLRSFLDRFAHWIDRQCTASNAGAACRS
jgi:chromate reductase